MKQTTFWRCFLTENRVLMGKTFNGDRDSSGITDSCSGCGQPHNAHPTAKINKVKAFAMIFWSVSLPHQEKKNILSKRFYVFFHSHPLNEMFIVNGKSHCCNDTFTDVLFTSLLAKNSLKEYTLFLCCQNRNFISCFRLKLVTFSKIYARKKWLFFSEHSVYSRKFQPSA